jgi:hypothetical protein
MAKAKPAEPTNSEPPMKKTKVGGGQAGQAEKTTSDVAMASGGHANGGPASGGHADGGPAVAVSPLDFGTHGQMPTVPAWGSESVIWEAYYEKMVDWVRKVTPMGLQQLGINVSDVGGALPTRIQENTSESGRSALTTFRGDWDVEACVQAMDTTNMYENCGSAHWLNVKSGKVMFGGEVVMDEHTPWTQVMAALHCWSWDRYLCSSEKPVMRRLIFPVTVPSACYATSDAQKSIQVTRTLPDGKEVTEGRPTFQDIPVLAGRAHILAMYVTMGQCLVKWGEQDQKHFLKVWEACYQNFHLVMPFADPP